MEKNETAIQFEDVMVKIGTRVILSKINLAIAQKKITGIIGSNGAGKSTLLSLIIGLRGATKGTVTVLGEKLPTKNNALRRRIGVVLQETALYEELTVYENLRFSAALYGIAQEGEKINEVLSLLGLTERANDRCNTLSGGLRRRTAVARALLHNPELLVIDEPTLGVDAETRHAIWSHLRSLVAKGITIVVSTNYMDEAQALCDSVSVLQEGKVIVSETPVALIARAGHILDIECDKEETTKIIQALTNKDGIIRIEQTQNGASIFFNGKILPDAIIRTVLQVTSLTGFRSRPADLSEIFKVLQEGV